MLMHPHHLIKDQILHVPCKHVPIPLQNKAPFKTVQTQGPSWTMPSKSLAFELAIELQSNDGSG